MTTEKQIAANRLNARKSTGPRTPEGKNRSRLNAVTHGLTARTPILAVKHHRETAEAYTRLHTALVRRFRPVSPEQHLLVASIADSTWLLGRLRFAAGAILRADSTSQPDSARPASGSQPDPSRLAAADLLHPSAPAADSPSLSLRAQRSNLSSDLAVSARLAVLEEHYMRLTRHIEDALSDLALLQTESSPDLTTVSTQTTASSPTTVPADTDPEADNATFF